MVSDHHHHPDQPPKDNDTSMATMGSHGMLVVGDKSTFLSHLPMFMFEADNHPHNFQVILEVAFKPPPGGGPAADYVGDGRQHPSMMLYTFVPAEFEMDRLDPAARSIEALTGEVHRGHFERHDDDGGQAIGKATAAITNVVHFRAFEEGSKKPPELEYLLFGRGRRAVPRPPHRRPSRLRPHRLRTSHRRPCEPRGARCGHQGSVPRAAEQAEEPPAAR